MKKLIQRNGSRVSRPRRLATSVGGVAIAFTVAAGVVAAQANAAQPVRAKLRHTVLAIEGTKASDKIALRLAAGEPGNLQVDVGDDGTPDFSFQLARIAAIAVAAGAGHDLVRVDESNGAVNANIPTVIAGGDGNDTLAGGSGAETFLGGNGNDSIDGNRGNDVAFMGAGDDTFVWDPGDGSDTVEGQDGADTMVFNGAGIAERMDASANGSRLRFSRDPGNVIMDTAGVERVDVNALGGADLVSVNDLAGTDVSDVNVDLAGTLGGATGDGQADSVIVNGTNGNDAINVSGDASGVAVSGLAALVAIQHQEPNDGLAVKGLGGNDAISAAALADQAITLTLDGGAGDDTIAGGQGIETLLGSEGNDSIDGNGGNDAAFLGAGDDIFVWDPGDGSDVVEGQDGVDTMLFNGAGGAEQMELSANGNRLKFVRTQGNVTMNTAGVERVDVNALGGADLVTVNDLSGTDVSAVNVNLASTLGGATGDGQTDQVIVNGTNGNDTITVSGDAGGVNVKGLAPRIGILHSEAANDRLEINTLAGTDTVDTVGLAAGAIQLFVDGVLVP
jgi:Ca2+-binding RTX toxin-like protein